MIKRIAAFLILLYAGLWCLQQAPSHAAGWLPLAKASAGGGGTVAVDATSTAVTDSGTGVTTFTQSNLTIGGSATTLIYFVSFAPTAGTTAVSAVSATWNSVAMFAIGNSVTVVPGTNSLTNYIFGLRSPTTGAHTFSVSWTTSADAMVYGISFTGGDVTSNANAFQNFTAPAAGTTSPAAVTVTIGGGTGDLALGLFTVTDNITGFTTTTNTSIFAFNTGANGQHIAASRGTGSSSVALNYSFNATDHWGASGVDLHHN